MSTVIAAYVMNPATDYLAYGDEIRDGMWVLPDDPQLRRGASSDEESRQIRAQRFCRVTRLRDRGTHIAFIGEWVDGYQEAFGPMYHKDNAWIVKREDVPSAEAELGQIGTEGEPS